MSDLISRDELKSRVLQGQFKIGQDGTWYVLGLIDSAQTIETEEIFYDGYAYCLMDFGKDTVLCKDCKHWIGETHGCERHPSVEPWWETDSCNYGERKSKVEE